MSDLPSDSEENSYEEQPTQPQRKQPPKQRAEPEDDEGEEEKKGTYEVKNQPFDLAVDIETENNSIATNEREEEEEVEHSAKMMNMNALGKKQVDSDFKNSTFDRKGPVEMGEEQPDGEDFYIPGQYNPKDYEGLEVNDEIRELFKYVSLFKPQTVDLETKLKPFIPDYIPAVGKIEDFLKPDRPDALKEVLGLTVVDEPCVDQTDPYILDLQLRQNLKQKTTIPINIRSIEEPHKNGKQIAKYVTKINELHKGAPPPSVSYSKRMPNPDVLMDVWPEEMEQALSNIDLPESAIDLDLASYSKVILALLDIPYYPTNPNNKGLIEGLHLMFNIYKEFEENQHFKNMENGGQIANNQNEGNDVMQFNM